MLSSVKREQFQGDTTMSASPIHPAAGPATAIARFLLTFIFLSSVANKVMNFGPTTEYMATNGMPLPPLMLVIAIVLLVAGGLSVLLGYQARIGAALLILFLITATWFFHAFWTFGDPGEAQSQMIQFMKNMGLMGAMLFIIANGSGPWSLDGRKRAGSA
jgi:putative oxidoreductase